jgi:hypothetical protein
MKNDSDKLDLVRPAIAILAILLVIGGAIFYLNSLDKQRKNEVYQQYKQETDSYIEKNRPGLTTLFEIITAQKPCTFGTTCSASQPIKDQIDQKLTHDLKDWSSTMFMVRSNGSEGINIIRLSGDTSQYYSYPTEKKIEVLKMLNGEVSDLPWDEYTYELPGKEVIVPIKNSQGQIMGAIVRGVIEEKSF